MSQLPHAAATRVPACAGVPAPIPGNENTWQWTAVSYLNTAITAMFASAGASWVLNTFAPELVSVDALCASNPPVPEPFATGDWGSALASLTAAFPSPEFMVKLNEYVKYGMFEHFCQCTSAPLPPPVPPTPPGPPWCTSATRDPLDIGGGVTTTPVYLTGTLDPSVYGPDQDGLYDICVTSNNIQTSSPGTVGISLEPVDASGNTFQQARGIVIYPADPLQTLPYNATFTFTPGGVGARWTIRNHNDTTQVCGNSATWSPGRCPSSAPIPPQPPPTSTPPPLPPAACDADTLCQITWLINRFIVSQTNYTSNTNVQVTNISNGTQPVVVGPPPEYTAGASHQLVGTGQAAVSSGTLGLAVTVNAWPPLLDPRPTTPTDFWNIGWLVTGNTFGWDRKAWIRRSGQRVFPGVQPMTRFSWNLAEAVTMTAVELM